jgi:hypothetical protein
MPATAKRKKDYIDSRMKREIQNCNFQDHTDLRKQFKSSSSTTMPPTILPGISLRAVRHIGGMEVRTVD